MDWILNDIEKRFENPLKIIFSSKTWKNNIKIVNEFVYNLIQARRQEGFKGKQDFLANLLSMEANKEAEGITQTFLRDQVINFFLAGRDTTAVLLTWTSYLLSTHPDIDQQVIREIRSVLENQLPDIHNTKLLKYTRMVLDESLRLYPPAVPFNSKQCTKDITLPNKIRVHKGQNLEYSPYAIHRLPEYWGPDANEFRPERWENPKILKHPYQFVPFQKGPRLCLGMNMAYEEATSCLVELIQNGIRFEYVGKENPPTFSLGAILSSKYAVPVKVKLV